MERPPRLFVSQLAMDRWLSEGRVEVEDDRLTMVAEQQSFRIQTGVLFTSEVTGQGDAALLVGKVKDLEQLAALGADYSAGSVILGDNAYEVLEGFLGEPEFVAKPSLPPSATTISSVAATSAESSGGDLAAAMRQATGDVGGGDELALLARFFVGKNGR